MKKVIASRRVELGITTEVQDNIETETGGFLLGYRDGDTFYAVEFVEPGPKFSATKVTFEYDAEFVQYRANKLQKMYKYPLQLLGLWHRHPGVLNTFSSTDDVTNKMYADMLEGAISGIVTLGHGFEMTMYYVPEDIRYEKMEWIVDDTLIPKEYQQLKDAKEVQKEMKACEEENVFYAFKDKAAKVLKGVDASIFPGGGGMNEKAKTLKQQQKEEEVGLLFDAIEPDICYLQEAEERGELKTEYSNVESRKGKNGLYLKITDLKEAGHCYKILLSMDEGSIQMKAVECVVKKNVEEGTYKKQLIKEIVEGKKNDPVN